MLDKEKNFVSAVAYMHNFTSGVHEFLGSLLNTLNDNFENYEVILVDDHSSDGTSQTIKDFCSDSNDSSITLVSLGHYHGVEFAMRAGVDLAIGDFVFEFDSPSVGLSQDLIMKLYYKALEGFDIVSAAPSKQRLSSRLFYFVFNGLADMDTTIGTETLRIVSRRAINRVAGSSRSIPYRKAAYANCGLPQVVLAYEAEEKPGHGHEKEEQRFRGDLATDSLVLFTHVGYNIARGLSVLMMVFTLAIALYSLLVYFNNGAIAGWTTTILFLSFAFFCLFGILSIVVKYLQIIVDLVFKKKDYSFESIERL